MKKFILIAVVAVAVTSACRKTHTCECTETTTDTPNGGSAVVGTPHTTKDSKDKQKKKLYREEESCYSTTSTTTYTWGTHVVDNKCDYK
jgi:hypothetical protein